MTKNLEHQHNSQQPMYPTQMPSAPPSYDEAINGPPINQPYGAYMNPPYPTQATSGMLIWASINYCVEPCTYKRCVRSAGGFLNLVRSRFFQFWINLNQISAGVWTKSFLFTSIGLKIYFEEEFKVIFKIYFFGKFESKISFCFGKINVLIRIWWQNILTNVYGFKSDFWIQGWRNILSIFVLFEKIQI